MIPLTEWQSLLKHASKDNQVVPSLLSWKSWMHADIMIVCVQKTVSYLTLLPGPCCLHWRNLNFLKSFLILCESLVCKIFLPKTSSLNCGCVHIYNGTPEGILQTTKNLILWVCNQRKCLQNKMKYGCFQPLKGKAKWIWSHRELKKKKNPRWIQ
jgi:hypothetical protein